MLSAIALVVNYLLRAMQCCDFGIAQLVAVSPSKSWFYITNTAETGCQNSWKVFFDSNGRAEAAYLEDESRVKIVML